MLSTSVGLKTNRTLSVPLRMTGLTVAELRDVDSTRNRRPWVDVGAGGSMVPLSQEGGDSKSMTEPGVSLLQCREEALHV